MERDFVVICGAQTTLQGYGIEQNRIPGYEQMTRSNGHSLHYMYISLDNQYLSVINCHINHLNVCNAFDMINN